MGGFDLRLRDRAARNLQNRRLGGENWLRAIGALLDQGFPCPCPYPYPFPVINEDGGLGL